MPTLVVLTSKGCVLNSEIATIMSRVSGMGVDPITEGSIPMERNGSSAG